jgi:hypothetical protein
MNVYQKILVKLYKETSGKTSNKVDFADLVKKEGFYPSYQDIYKQMSDQGWIVDSGRGDSVFITPWGIKEAKKVSRGGDDSARQLERAANRLRAEVKEFMVMTEEFVSDTNEESFNLVESKFEMVKNSLRKVKEII